MQNKHLGVKITRGESEKKNCTMIAQQVTNIDNHLAKAYVAWFPGEAKA